jgi:ABC-type cobalamin/Fe3+-siderophores transport system ATPase subunit
MKQDTIHINGLSIGYHSKSSTKLVAKGIHSTIYSGELTCLLGANGVGKSTLLRTLSAFQPKLDGEILVLGKDIDAYSDKELSTTIGVVLTDKCEIRNMLVRELVGMGRSPYTGFWGKLSKDDKRIVEESIALVRIEELASRMVHTLSDGERQKVMIAKALAQETPVIYLDEPTAFLDFPSKVEIMQLLHHLTRKTNKTIFMSTHDLELALQISDKIWLMDKANGIFSGLNNIDVDTLLDRPMCTAFGFTQVDVDTLLDSYSLGDQKSEVKHWYNGYLFGNEVVYNPWSVLNYINKGGVFAPYWVNTGSDVLLRHLIAEGPSQVRKGIETLVQGGSLCSVINDKLAFPDLLSSASNIWSFMLFSGYLKASEGRMTPDHLMSYTLGVPNTEVSTVFSTIIRGWINDGPVKNDRLEMMLQALDENEMNIFQRLLNDFVVNTLSYYDTNGREPEKVYQAFLLGMLVSNGAYEVSSNRESGLGRYDILLRPRDLGGRGFIMELKVYDPMFDESVDKVLDSALAQIEKKQYAATLHAAGVRDILKMAITFDGKRVWVKTTE